MRGTLNKKKEALPTDIISASKMMLSWCYCASGHPISDSHLCLIVLVGFSVARVDSLARAPVQCPGDVIAQQTIKGEEHVCEIHYIV